MTIPAPPSEPSASDVVPAKSNARLDHRACYQAISRRDRRFDGKFYTAVKTTGIFCRPSCPARTPASGNVTFYAHAAGALDAGFRPCRRCRPELAPAHPEWNRRADLASKALALIEQGVVDREGVGGLASRLGVSERHLRRELQAEVGTGPNQLARTRRILLARTLLDQTSLAITDIAFAAGFTSIRQFNDSFRQAFDATPTELRRRPGRARPGPQQRTRAGGEGTTESTVNLTLGARGQLGWPALLSFLAARAIPGLESAGPLSFRRNVPGGWIELQAGDDDRTLDITCRLDELNELSYLIPTIRLVCDLDSDLEAIGSHLSPDPDLTTIVAQQPVPGSVPRLPGTFDRFELAVRAVVGQQISVAAARTTLGRLLTIVRPETDAHHHFPSPDEILAAPLEQLGMPTRRRDTIRTLAEAVAEGRVNLSPEVDPERVEGELLALPGIGPWTAGYIVMRALGHPDGWPSSDLVLAKRLGVSGPELNARAERWRPWRAYAAMAIWQSPGVEGAHPNPSTTELKR